MKKPFIRRHVRKCISSNNISTLLEPVISFQSSCLRYIATRQDVADVRSFCFLPLFIPFGCSCVEDLYFHSAVFTLCAKQLTAFDNF